MFNEGGLIGRAQKAKELYESDAKKEEEQMNKLEQEVEKYAKERENENKTETITESIKGAFIKYDVEYTDTYKNYEYTSTNGWRLENYELAEDGKTLSNVRLISTGVPARMYYYYNDTSNNYSKWIKDNTKLTEFKNNVLGTDYTTYTGSETYYSLQASAGFYYNLGKMTFEQGTSYNKKNQGYYTKIKNENATYTSGETIGDNLFKARNDASIRMLTLPELNRALGRDDIDSTSQITDTTGLYRLDQISTGTALTNNTYDTGYYWLASPYPNASINSLVCNVSYDGGVSGSNSSGLGVRPLVSLESRVQLVKKTDASGFVYYEMVNVN